MKQLLQQALQETNGFVTHTDLDGLISAAYFYHKTRKPLTGICNLSTSGITKLRTTASCEELPHQLFIDLSIVDNSWSIDHHYLPIDYLPHKSINANKYYESQNLSQKNPTGNILWLMWLFEENLQQYSTEQLQLLATADGLCSTYKKYKSNVESWACSLDFEPVLEAIEKVNQNDYNSFFNLLSLDKINFSAKGEIKWHKDSYYFTYTTIAGEEKVSLQTIFTKIAEFFGWSPLSVPTFVNTLTYKNYETSSLPNKLNNNVTFAAQIKSEKFVYSKFQGFEC